MPVERSAIALNADAVRSMTRLFPHVLPQQCCWLQKLFVSGPQSAILTLTQLELQRFVT